MTYPIHIDDGKLNKKIHLLPRSKSARDLIPRISIIVFRYNVYSTIMGLLLARSG